MGYYIRKSIKLGPVRLNLSKSGLGVSSGIKGARISTGPRGTYINLGRNGIYYRHRIDNFVIDRHSASHIEDKPKIETRINDIPTANAAELVDSSSKELLAQINTRIHQPSHAGQVGIAATVLAGILAAISLAIPTNAILELGNGLVVEHPYVLALIWTSSFVVWLIGLSIAYATHQQEILGQTTTLRYALDSEAKDKFLSLQKALGTLAKVNRIWQLTSRTTNVDLKRHAGATSNITRTEIAAGFSSPPYLQTGFNVQGLLLSTMKLYFLPDHLLVFQSGLYGAVSYDLLHSHVQSARFVESEGVPSDSNIVDYTWQYVNKNGGPDKRFSNNRKLPIAEYGLIELSSPSGLNLQLHVSSLDVAQQLVQALQDYSRKNQAPFRTSSTQESRKSAGYQRTAQPNIKRPIMSDTPYTILKIDANASRDEVTVAYRKLAQQYHPDKVAALGPEFKELAEERMKAINAAYAEIQRTFKS